MNIFGILYTHTKLISVRKELNRKHILSVVWVKDEETAGL